MTSTTTALLRALVVDGTAVRRAAVARSLESDGDIAVVGVADYGDALDAVQRLRPNVIVLAHGAGPASTSALESVMAFAPTPVVVLRAPGDASPAAERGDMAAGAVGVVEWPAPNGDDGRLRQRVRVLHKVAVVRHPRGSLRNGKPRSAAAHGRERSNIVVGMAASTGGPHTLVEVVRELASIAVPVLIVQHIHPEFVDGFAQWISRATNARVLVAENDMLAEPGTFYVAPSGQHLKVTPSQRLVLDREPASLHCPSANELFKSMAASLGRAAVGVLLTGMGDDGAEGLLAVQAAGGTTIVQDGATSTIDGMPRAARDRGAAGVVAPLHGIAPAVLRAIGARA